MRYDLPGDLIGKVWQGRYRGQSQKWFALRFLGSDDEIDPAAVANPESDGWQWMAAGDLAARLHQGAELQRGFMINYNLYRHYFPLMALGRARGQLAPGPSHARA